MTGLSLGVIKGEVRYLSEGMEKKDHKPTNENTHTHTYNHQRLGSSSLSRSFITLKGSRCPRGGVNWAFLKINCKN
jgi:hypothetical protein